LHNFNLLIINYFFKLFLLIKKYYLNDLISLILNFELLWNFKKNKKMDRNNYINSDHIEVYKKFNNELKEISEIINKYTEINEVLILAEGMIDIDLAKFISNLKTKKIKKLNIEYCGNEAMKELCNFLEIIYI